MDENAFLDQLSRSELSLIAQFHPEIDVRNAASAAISGSSAPAGLDADQYNLQSELQRILDLGGARSFVQMRLLERMSGFSQLPGEIVDAARKRARENVLAHASESISEGCPLEVLLLSCEPGPIALLKPELEVLLEANGGLSSVGKQLVSGPAHSSLVKEEFAYVLYLRALSIPELASHRLEQINQILERLALRAVEIQTARGNCSELVAMAADCELSESVRIQAKSAIKGAAQNSLKRFMEDLDFDLFLDSMPFPNLPAGALPGLHNPKSELWQRVFANYSLFGRDDILLEIACTHCLRTSVRAEAAQLAIDMLAKRKDALGLWSAAGNPLLPKKSRDLAARELLNVSGSRMGIDRLFGLQARARTEPRKLVEDCISSADCAGLLIVWRNTKLRSEIRQEAYKAFPYAYVSHLAERRDCEGLMRAERSIASRQASELARAKLAEIASELYSRALAGIKQPGSPDGELADTTIRGKKPGFWRSLGRLIRH